MKDVKKLSDEELVRLVCNRDRELYKEVVRRYQGGLMRYAAYLVRDRDRAADITQEAFIKAFVNLRGFDTGKKFSSWIYRITHNEAMNYLRKHGKEVSLDVDAVIGNADGESDVERDVARGQLKKEVASCLDKLPLIYRSPLALFYLENKSYGEISDVLRVPVGTVGTRINRGKKLLAEVCREKGLETYAKR